MSNRGGGILLFFSILISTGICSLIITVFQTGMQATEFIRGIAEPYFSITYTAQENPVRNPLETKDILNNLWLEAIAADETAGNPELDLHQIADGIVYDVKAEDPLLIIDIKNEGAQAEFVQTTIVLFNALDRNATSIEDHERCDHQFENDLTLSIACDRLTRGDTITISIRFSRQENLTRTFGIEITNKEDPFRNFEIVEKSSRIGLIFINANNTDSLREDINWNQATNTNTVSRPNYNDWTLWLLGIIIGLFIIFRFDKIILWRLLELMIRRR